MEGQEGQLAAPVRAPVAVLANHTAGRGRHRRLLPAIRDRLAAAGRELWELPTDNPAAVRAAAYDAVADGAAALVVIGGDGTLHEVLPALAGSGVPLGVVPVGTGNDLAAGLGLTTAPLPAVDRIVAALRAGTTRAVDLARVTDRSGNQWWYGSVLAAGFDAIVNERANRMRWPRGDLKYDLAMFRELVGLRPRHYLLHVDGTAYEFDGVLVAVGNTPTYGGGFRICPDADPTDGLLDVVVGAAMSRTTLVGLRRPAYRGTHVHHRLVSTYRGREVRIATDSPEGIVAYADGEAGSALPVTITAEPQALLVLAT